MPRQTKSTSAASAAPAVSVTVEPVAPAPAAEKKQRKSKAVAEAAPAPTSVVDAAPVADAPVAEAPAGDDLSTKLAGFAAKIHEIGSLHSSLKAEYKALEKSIQKELKQAQKASGKKRRSSGNKKPSGFANPTGVSEEMLKFLGKEAGTMMSRIEVSKEINAYIKAHSLKDAANGRQINADAKLGKLLKLNKGDVLTFFNLQKYLKSHFIKPAAPATA